MTSISKNVHIDKLDNIVNKQNNIYHSTTKIKSVDVKSGTYVDFSKEDNQKDSKSKINDIVRISEYWNFLQKNRLQIRHKKFLGLKRLKMLHHGQMLLTNLMVKNCWNILWERIAKRRSKVI